MKENSLVEIQNKTLDIAHLGETAKEYIEQAKAPNTLKAYRSDWNDFQNWCFSQKLGCLPADPETLVLYLTALIEDGFKTSTLQRRLSSISQAHQAAGFESPSKHHTVQTVWAGIRRTKGTANVGKAPIFTEDIRRIVDILPENMLGIRDRALLLLGFAGAFRRSELVALNVEDLSFTREGLVVIVRKSKTDQEGQGQKKGIFYGGAKTCPVQAVKKWLELSGINSGPLFRPINRHGQLQDKRLSSKAVAIVVKRTAQKVGLNPEYYSGHSLRAGFATSAARTGASERSIMKQTGHRSESMVRRYIREASLFTDNAASSLGL